MKENVRALGKQQEYTLLQLDANFFYERAIRSLDRFHYDKALKYFQKAVDYEPNNPINYCNMAGVLSEIGKYGESNTILQKVINEIDPDMTECHFYMANNFANMEFFEEAERELLHYLQEDEEGHFLEEAEEMIEFLQYELERPTPLTKVKAKAGVYEHIRARELLEDGQFPEAIELLESIREEHPDFLAARNNLALAYYYVGHADKAKQSIDDVLKQDAVNLHALCNLAIFLHYEGKHEELKKLIPVLTKLDPFYQEHLFKLATTMGILKEHEAALRHFQRLTKQGEAKKDPCLNHFTAIAACNASKWGLAEKYWLLHRGLDEHSPLPDYFLILLKLIKEEPLLSSLSYSYYGTVEEQMGAWEHQARERGLELDPRLRQAFFYWAVEHSNREGKLKAIYHLEHCYNEEVELKLMKFLLKPDEDDYLKRLVMYTLRSMGMKDAFEVMLSGKLLHVEAERVPAIESSHLMHSDPLWERVAELVLANTAKRYNVIQQHDMVALWVNFLSKGYSSISMSRLTKIEAWAAALEYLVAKMYNKPITYHDAAVRYGTSITTISKRVKEIDSVLGIKSKMKDAPWLMDFSEN